MRRRDLPALLAGLPMIPPGLAQTRGTMPVACFLGLASEQADRPLLEALRQGLAERGHVE